MVRSMIRFSAVVLQLAAVAALSGCFSGDKESYPHNDAHLVRPLPAGLYTSTDRDGAVTIIKLMAVANGKHSAVTKDDTYEVGFYPNTRTTYLMYAKGNKMGYLYFLAQPTQNGGMLVYDATEAAESLLSQWLGQKTFARDSPLPFTTADRNKLFLTRLG